MARRSTPEERAGTAEKSVRRIKRQYKVALSKPKRYALGEKEHIADMVIVLKLAQYSNNQIGSVVNISRGQVAEILSQPETAERLLTLRSNLPAAALDLLHGYSIEAVQAIVDVMRSTEDDGLILKAASEILDRAGIAKVSKSEGTVHQTRENKLTIGADQDMTDQLRSLSPELQEQAAAMMENFENFLLDATKEPEE